MSSIDNAKELKAKAEEIRDEAHEKRLAKDERALTGISTAVMELIMVICVAILGFYVAGIFYTNMGGNNTSLPFYTSVQNIISAGNQGTALIVVVVVVFFGALAFLYLRGAFGGGNNKQGRN